MLNWFNPKPQEIQPVKKEPTNIPDQSSEYICSPNKNIMDFYEPPPIEDTSTPLEKSRQHGCFALAFHDSHFQNENTHIVVGASWRVVVSVRGNKKYLFLTEKDKDHLLEILQPENRPFWTKDSVFGFERPGMKFYIPFYVAPLVLMALLECQQKELMEG